MSVNVFYNVRAEIRDLQGNLISVSEGHNLVVNSGLGLLRDILGGNGYRPDEMQAGTGTSSTTAGMTALQTSVITKTVDRRVNSGYGIQFQSLIGSGEANGYTLSEIGTFQQSTMLARSLISPTIPKTSLVTVTLLHTITFAAG